MKNCKTCDKKLENRNKSGYCASHVQSNPESRERTQKNREKRYLEAKEKRDSLKSKCLKCGTVLNSHNTIGYCRQHRKMSPIQREKDRVKSKADRKTDKGQEYVREYNKNHKEERKIYKKQYYQDNKDEIKQEQKEYRILNKEKIKENKKEYYQNTKERDREKNNAVRLKNYDSEKIRIRNEKNRNKPEYIAWKKAWAKEYNKTANKKSKERKKNDPLFKLATVLRTRLWMALKHDWKTGSAVRDLGCTIEELKLYLESKFLPGMTWGNHGKGDDKWHIDHIIPLASFDLTDRVQFLKACHYTNLQPLWAIDNMKKGSKI